MASLQQFLHPPRASVESPAKIFAKLKSKVRREYEGDVIDNELYGGPRTQKRRAFGEDEIQHEGFTNNSEVTAITLSPISSPEKPARYRPEDEHEEVLRLAPRLKPSMESTSLSNMSTTTQRCRVGDFNFTGSKGRREPAESMILPKTRQKRRLEEQFLNEANTMKSATDYDKCQEKRWKSVQTCSEDDHSPNTRSVDPAQLKCSNQVVDTAPPHPATPAKIFAYLKERESQRDQCGVRKRCSNRKPVSQRDNRREEKNENRRSDSYVDNQSEVMEESDSAVSRVQESQSPDRDSSQDSVWTAPSQPVVLEDALLLASPRVSIPKIQLEFPQAVLKSKRRLPQSTTVANENVIHLRKWLLRKTHHGLYVEGIHRENNIPWNSNIILERVSKTTLKTITGRVYVLVGKMDLAAPSQFPKWFLKTFANGFPTTWKEIFENYLSQSKSGKKGLQGQNELKRQKSKTTPEQSQQQQQQKKSTRTYESTPSSATSGLQMTRSGRLIKPPLEYWRGGRIVLDADMNVTIHDDYNSVINPEVADSINTKSSGFKIPSKKADPVKTISNDDCVHQELSSQSVLVRKVKAVRGRTRETKDSDIEKPPNHVPTDSVLRSSRTTEPQGSNRKTNKTNKEPKVTKAQSVRVNQTTASRQRSHPVYTASSSQPSNSRQIKQDMPKKTRAKTRASTDKNSPVRPPRRSSRNSRSSLSSNSSVDQENHSNNPQKPQSKRIQPQRSKTSSSKKTQISPQKTAQPKKRRNRAAQNNRSSTLDDNAWTEEELRKLQEAVSCHPKHILGYWTKVAMMVGTRSAEECNYQYSCQGAFKSPQKREKKSKKKVPLKEKGDNPVITAGMKTLRRKQQVRDFLDAMPKEDMDDAFSSEYMWSKRFEMQSMCPGDDHGFSMSEPLTPKSSGFPEAKTPQCLHITPGMIGSSSRNFDDKYVFQLQKRMKNHYQFNVQKNIPKNFSPTASLKKTMRRCGNTENDTFIVWEMFSDKEAQIDSEEEEDFYFSEND